MAAKEANRIAGVAWVGIKRGGVYTGTLPVPIGSFLFQAEGQRMVAIVPCMECLGLMQRQAGEGVSEIPDDLTADMAPQLMQDYVFWEFQLTNTVNGQGSLIACWVFISFYFYFCFTASRQDIVQFLLEASGSFVEQFMPASFRYGYVQPGDILYVPGGSLLIEKAVVNDNIVLRVPSPLISTSMVDSVIFACSTTSAQCLVGFSMF